ncbi:hypothetical protein WJW27_004860 [Escherichia coli]
MKYKMMYTPSLVYVELESNDNGWNFIKHIDTNTWYMAHLDNNVVSDHFMDFNTLEEDEFFQVQLVLDTNGFDMVLLRNIQKAVNELIAEHNLGEIRISYDLEVL